MVITLVSLIFFCTILTNAIKLYSPYILFGIQETKGHFERSKNKEGQYCRCLSEQVVVNETKKDNFLFNEDGVSLLDLEKLLNGSGIFEDEEEIERVGEGEAVVGEGEAVVGEGEAVGGEGEAVGGEEGIEQQNQQNPQNQQNQQNGENGANNNEHFNYKRNAPFLLFALMQLIFTDIINKIPFDIYFHMKEISKRLLSLNSTSPVIMLVLYYHITNKSRDFVKLLKTEILEELDNLYRSLNLRTDNDIMYLERKIANLEYSENICSLLPLESELKSININRKELERDVKNACAILRITDVLNLRYSCPFPFCYIQYDLNINPIGSIRECIYGIINDIKRAIKPKKWGKMYEHEGRLTVEKVQGILNRIDLTIEEIDNNIKSVTFKLLKKLSNVSGGPLRGIIGLFILLFNKAVTNRKYIIGDNFFKQKFFVNNKDMEQHITKVKDLEMHYIMLGKMNLKQFFHEIFKIDISDRKWNILMDKFHESNYSIAIEDSVLMLITLSFYRNFIIPLKNIVHDVLEKIKERDKNENTKRKYLHIFCFFSTDPFIKNQKELYNSFKTHIRPFKNVMELLRDQIKLDDAYRRNSSMVKCCQQLIRVLLLIEKRRQILEQESLKQRMLLTGEQESSLHVDIWEPKLNAQEQDLKEQETIINTMSQMHTNGKEKGNQKENKNEITENKNEITENKDEMTENKDEITENKDEITENKDEITENKDEITENKDEITENKDESETGILDMFAAYDFCEVHKETTVAELYLLFYIIKNVAL